MVDRCRRWNNNDFSNRNRNHWLLQGKWQITDFTGRYENLGDYVYNAHIEGDE